MITQTKHTPGPWKSAKSGPITGRTVWRNNGDEANTGYERICRNVSSEANARLIAAAPELLEACKAALAFVEAHSDKTVDWAQMRESLRHVISHATSHPENFATNPATCEHNEAWGKKCGKPATNEVRIEGYEDIPMSACEFHAALAEHDGFDVRKREARKACRHGVAFDRYCVDCEKAMHAEPTDTKLRRG